MSEGTPKRLFIGLVVAGVCWVIQLLFQFDVNKYASNTTLTTIIVLMLTYQASFWIPKPGPKTERYEKQPSVDRTKLDNELSPVIENHNVSLKQLRDKLKDDDDAKQRDLRPHHAPQREKFCDEWVLAPFLDLNRCTSYTKVWIMGKFKVGKSLILSKLGIANCLSSTIQHTLGEVFLPDHENNIIYVDSEGFDQAVNSDDPELKMNFVINHAKACADFIILVLPMMSIADRKLMLKSISLLKGYGFRLIIVHNLKDICTPADLEVYEKRMFCDLKLKHDLDPLVLTKEVAVEKEKITFNIIDTNYQKISVINLFLADDNTMARYNDCVITHLKSNLVGVRQKTPMLQSLVDSLKFTYFWAYNIVENSLEATVSPPADDPKQPNKQLQKITIAGETMGKRQIIIQDNVIIGSGIEYSWLLPQHDLEKDIYYQKLVLGISKVDVESINLSIEDERTITVHYCSQKLTPEGKVLTLGDRKEILHTEWITVATPQACKEWNISKEVSKTNEAVFTIQLAYSKTLYNFVYNHDEAPKEA